MPNVEELKRQLAEAEATQAAEAAFSTQTNTPTFHRPQETALDADPYAVTTWAEPDFDFVTPSGQRCRLKKLDLSELAESGILDRVTRLPGLAGELIEKSQGQPPKPTADEMPDRDTIKAVVEMTNIIVPMVVVKPEIFPLPSEKEERVSGRIYVDSIDIADRVAIMNRVLGGLQKLDSFRQ